MDVVNLFQHYILSLPPLNDENFEVNGIYSEAKEVQQNSVYVAVRGTRGDGHQHIPLAIAKGASVLVVENTQSVPSGFSGRVYLVLNARRALSDLAARFYDHPSLRLRCVGVTGTNGKSSTVLLLEHLLSSAQIPTGVIGTIDHHFERHRWETALTTPGPLLLQSRLSDFACLGAKAVAIEISSHALEQNRVDHLALQTVIFTNLTRDHLDYHKTMDDYFQAKELLFTQILEKSPIEPCFAIVNINSSYGRRLRVSSSAVLWTYGRKDGDFVYKIISSSYSGTRFILKTPIEEVFFDFPLIGEYNVENAVAAVLGALSFGVSLIKSAQSLINFRGVPGRLERVPNEKGLHVFIDYAHTPDALENVLKTLNQIRRQGQPHRITTVFGCGGDRDPGKRPMMGKVAEKYSNQLILTNDNPRTENPDQILEQIKGGISRSFLTEAVIIEKDRVLAIQKALQLSKPGDVVLIAGKGHENYQIIGQEKFPMSDYQTAESVLKGVNQWV